MSPDAIYSASVLRSQYLTFPFADVTDALLLIAIAAHCNTVAKTTAYIGLIVHGFDLQHVFNFNTLPINPIDSNYVRLTPAYIYHHTVTVYTHTHTHTHNGQVNLGNMYYNGLGVPKDKAKARALYTEAADSDKNAQALLEELDMEEQREREQQEKEHSRSKEDSGEEKPQ